MYKKGVMKRFLSIILAVLLGLGPEVTYAQDFMLSSLPPPGVAVGVSAAFDPVVLKGMVIFPKEPLKFRFIVDSGMNKPDNAILQQESTRMMKYFLAAVTVPEKDQWVNLSPYEHERMIADSLGGTDLGRDMLGQDYMLKQLTATMMNPDQGVGKDFWTRVYAQAKAKFGTTDVPVDTFNKVWIMPDTAEVFARGNAVYVTKAHLKVMLDSDYLAQKTGITRPDGDQNDNGTRDIAKQILREIMIPAIEREVNAGANFATLRQIYYAGILARWYRDTIKDSLMASAYMDKARISGVDLSDKTLKEQIYQRYISAYSKGVVNFIREENDPLSGESIPRKYFSGGITRVSPAQLTHTDAAALPAGSVMTIDFAAARADAATTVEINIAQYVATADWPLRGYDRLSIVYGAHGLPQGFLLKTRDKTGDYYVMTLDERLDLFFVSASGENNRSDKALGLEVVEFIVQAFPQVMHDRPDLKPALAALDKSLKVFWGKREAARVNPSSPAANIARAVRINVSAYSTSRSEYSFKYLRVNYADDQSFLSVDLLSHDGMFAQYYRLSLENGRIKMRNMVNDQPTGGEAIFRLSWSALIALQDIAGSLSEVDRVRFGNDFQVVLETLNRGQALLKQDYQLAISSGERVAFDQRDSSASAAQKVVDIQPYADRWPLGMQPQYLRINSDEQGSLKSVDLVLAQEPRGTPVYYRVNFDKNHKMIFKVDSIGGAWLVRSTWITRPLLNHLLTLLPRLAQEPGVQITAKERDDITAAIRLSFPQWIVAEGERLDADDAAQSMLIPIGDFVGKLFNGLTKHPPQTLRVNADRFGVTRSVDLVLGGTKKPGERFYRISVGRSNKATMEYVEPNFIYHATSDEARRAVKALEALFPLIHRQQATIRAFNERMINVRHELTHELGRASAGQDAAGVTNGGIDIRNIDVARTGENAVIRFDEAALQEMADQDFNGLKPVLMGMALAASPLAAMGY